MDALDTTLKIEERLVQKATLMRIPLGAGLELTPLCNMDCSMCFIRHSKQEMMQKGSIKSVEEWLQIAQKMKEAGTLFILISGGEPFLYKDFMKLYKGLKTLGFIITINTNATLLNEEIVKELAKDKPRRVNVTLYGSSNETYAKVCKKANGYDETIQGIKLLLKHHIDVKLNGTIVSENKDDIEKMIEVAKQLEVPIKMDTYIFPSSSRLNPFLKKVERLDAKEASKQMMKIHKIQKEDYKEYCQFICNHCNSEYQNRDYTCRAGRSSYWLTWNGKMTPCVFMEEPSMNVFEHSFSECWQNIINHMQKMKMPIQCGDCKNKEVCPVCLASVYCENKEYDLHPKYLCSYTEEMIKLAKEEVEVCVK